MSRRGRQLVALAVIALITAVVLLWPREQPPEAVPARVATQKPERKVRVHRAPARPEQLPEDPAPEDPAPEDPADEPPMALPFDYSTAEPSPRLSLLLVHVVYPDGSPVEGTLLLQSRDCQIWRGGRGPDLAVHTFEEACTVRVGRPDGRLFAWSDDEDVDLSGGTVAVQLVIPREQTGGLGVAFELDEEGMLVSRVWPGSPAERMGLEEGDVILEVDGLPTDTLTEDEFISVMTGPVDSTVEFVVGYDGDTGFEEETLTLTRARID